MRDKIQTTHLERLAIVYLRQSTLRQVHDHHESTVRQYALGQRAIELGWPPERVQIVDDDLGRSGTTTQGRGGFQHLAQDVAEGRVGAIFALEVSRLARSSADWHRLALPPADAAPLGLAPASRAPSGAASPPSAKQVRDGLRLVAWLLADSARTSP